MKNYKKIGIMGGTFDPPHLGHLISAEYVAEALGLDSVVFIPTGKKVYKESSAADAADRMNMTIAVQYIQCVCNVKYVEIRRLLCRK